MLTAFVQAVGNGLLQNIYNLKILRIYFCVSRIYDLTFSENDV